MKKKILFGIALVLAIQPLNAATVAVSVTDELSGLPLEGVVVTIDSEQPQQQAPLKTEMVQQDRRFIPHVIVVPTGSPVEFPNRDNTQHHVYSFSPAKPFNIELYAGKPETPVVFDKPGIVELGCNIHDQMKGFVVVTDNASRGMTNANGRVELAINTEDYPLTIALWHPRMFDNTRLEQRTLKAGDSTGLSLKVRTKSTPASALDRLQQRFLELE